MEYGYLHDMFGKNSMIPSGRGQGCWRASENEPSGPQQGADGSVLRLPLSLEDKTSIREEPRMADQDKTETATTLMHPLFGDVRKNWGWMLGFGILSIILGTIGLGMTPYLTLVGVTFFGALWAVGGAFQLAHAFKCKGWKSTLGNVLIGLIYIGAGLVMAIDPLRAAVVLTLMLGVVFLVVGALRIGVAFQHKGTRGWGWALAGGIVSIVLGLLVLSGWPVSGDWFIGLVIAIELIVNGWTYIFAGFAARSAGRGSAPGGGEKEPTKGTGSDGIA